MDIVRNVSVREVYGADLKHVDASNKPFETRMHRHSLPNIYFKGLNLASTQSEQQETKKSIPLIISATSNNISQKKTQQCANKMTNQQQMSEPLEDEYAINGRLEIRVVPQEQSPNPDESIYFDAIAATNTSLNIHNNINNPTHNPERRTQLVKGISSSDDIKDTLYLRDPASTMTIATKSESAICAVVMNQIIDSDSSSNIQKLPNNSSLMHSVISPQNAQSLASIKSHDNEYFGTTTVDANIENMECDIVTNSDIKKDNPENMCSFISHQFPPNHIPFNIAESNIKNIAGDDSSPNPAISLISQSNSVEQSIISVSKKECGVPISNSKIPILNPNVRILKCASWAGGDNLLQPDLQELTPGMYSI